MADWSPLADDVEVVTFAEHFTTEDQLAAAVVEFDLARPPPRLTASILERTVRHRLPSWRAAHNAWSTRSVMPRIWLVAVSWSPGLLCTETVTAARPSGVAAGHTM